MKYESAIVTNASGHINGLVASKNTYGQYFRGRVAGVNPRTTLQNIARAFFAAVSQTWRTLTKAQQAAWGVAAPLIVVKDSLGKTITLTGSAAYQSVNRRQVSAGLAQFDDPPSAVNAEPAVLSSTFNGSTGVGTIQFDAVPGNAGVYVVLASQVVGVGKNFIRQPTNLIGTTTTATFSFSATSGNTAAKALGVQLEGAAADSQLAFAAYRASTNSMPSPSVQARGLVTRP